MGFNLNKANAAKEKILNSFTPLELNEGNVQAIFNRCLAKPGETVTYAQVLQKALAGKNSDLIKFSHDRIRTDSKTISYLFGQLAGVHKHARLIPLEYGIVNYMETKWTTNANIILMLYELGVACDSITPFSLQEDKSLATDISAFHPTLSPKDPAFPSWWEAHKAEWEQ